MDRLNSNQVTSVPDLSGTVLLARDTAVSAEENMESIVVRIVGSNVEKKIGYILL